MKVKFTSLLCIVVTVLHFTAKAQNNKFPSVGSAGIGTTTPDTSALLEMKSTSKGLLIPRMTRVQRDKIVFPARGLMIYQTNPDTGFYYFNGKEWLTIAIKGADSALSNLSAKTAINENLLPKTNNKINLGSSIKAYKNIYFAGSLYAGSSKVIHFDDDNLNSLIGTDALKYNTSGSSNTAIGNSTLALNETGSLNTAVGAQSMLKNDISVANTAVGAYSLYNNNSDFNTSVGTNSLLNHMQGENNVAVGYAALYNHKTGESNVAIGSQALYFNVSGASNIAIGRQALINSKTSSKQVAIGDSAMWRYDGNNDGNVAIGSKVLYGLESGAQNTAIGFECLKNNTASNNTATGFNSLYTNTAGENNSAFGAFALSANTTGNGNTAVGKLALSEAGIGDNNTCIGNAAYPISNGITNYTGIGYFTGSQASASNMVELGNSSVTVIRGQVNFSTYSDERIKKNIKNNVPGLAFINLLKPATYNIDLDKENAIVYKNKISNDNNSANKYDIIKQLKTGFLAQEVEAAAKKLNYDFSGVVKPQNENDLYSLCYAEFVVPLVKAVQELSKMNDAKNASIDSLKNQNTVQQNINKNLQKQIDDLKAIILSSSQSSANQSSQLSKQNIELGSVASLSQNVPNPFKNSTIINYNLPVNNGNAYINFYGENGALLKTVKLSGNGKGFINIKTNELAAGTYRYTLMVDGKIVDSKQMISSK